MSDSSVAANVLLALPEATLRTQSAPTTATGTLYIQYLSVVPPSGTDSAAECRAYLVVRLNDIQFPIDPTRPIARHTTLDGTHVYTFILDAQAAHSLGFGDQSVPVSISLSDASEPARADSIDTLDQILEQYAGWEGARVQHPTNVVLHEGGGKPDNLRGRLVLMDEATGETVSDIHSQPPIHEDPALAFLDGAGGHDRKKGIPAEPVMLELPLDVYDAYPGEQTPESAAAAEVAEAREIFVRAIPPEEQDWITKSASLISHGVDSSTSLLVRGISSASGYYMKHTTPYSQNAVGAEPSEASALPSRLMTVLTHPTTHTALGYAHTATGHAAHASAKTVELVERMIRRAVGGRPTSNSSGAQIPSASTPKLLDSSAPSLPYLTSQPEKPPLPPRRDGSRSPATPLPPGRDRPGSPAPPLPARPSDKSSALPSTPGLSMVPADPSTHPPRTRDRLLVSANLVLATVDESAHRLWEAGSMQLGAAVGHRYGPSAAQSAQLVTGTARNVVLVYVDMRGFARRALIKTAGKELVKGRMSTRGRA